MSAKKSKANIAKQNYQPTAAEKDAIEKARGRITSGPVPRISVVNRTLKLDHPEPAVGFLLLANALGTTALKRYRSGGEQKVTVQNVSVSEGGRAIVGNVTQAPQNVASDKVVTSPPSLTYSPTPAMPMVAEAMPEATSRKRKTRK